jgi:predicted nucleic acid-binding protein
MPSKTKIERADYWDSCVFLAYLNGEPGRSDILENLLSQLEDESGRKIITSYLTDVEVAFLGREKHGGDIDPCAEAEIEAFLNRPYLVKVEISRAVVNVARRLMRLARSQGNSLRAPDAIHLGTAVWLKENGIPINRFLTYDDLAKHASVTGLDIGEPSVQQDIELPLLAGVGALEE